MTNTMASQPAGAAPPYIARFDLGDFLRKMAVASIASFRAVVDWLAKLVHYVGQLFGVKVAVDAAESDGSGATAARNPYRGRDWSSAEDAVFSDLSSHSGNLPIVPQLPCTVSFIGEQSAALAAQREFAAYADAILAEPWAFGESPADGPAALRMFYLAVEKAQTCRLAHQVGAAHARRLAEEISSSFPSGMSLDQVLEAVAAAPDAVEERDQLAGQLRALLRTVSRIASTYHQAIARANTLAAGLVDQIDREVLRFNVENACDEASLEFDAPLDTPLDPTYTPLAKVLDVLAVLSDHPAEVLDHAEEANGRPERPA